MDYVRNPIWLMNVLHNLQLQLFFHSLICLLKGTNVLKNLGVSIRGECKVGAPRAVFKLVGALGTDLIWAP